MRNPLIMLAQPAIPRRIVLTCPNCNAAHQRDTNLGQHDQQIHAIMCKCGGRFDVASRYTTAGTFESIYTTWGRKQANSRR